MSDKWRIKHKSHTGTGIWQVLSANGDFIAETDSKRNAEMIVADHNRPTSAGLADGFARGVQKAAICVHRVAQGYGPEHRGFVRDAMFLLEEQIRALRPEEGK